MKLKENSANLLCLDCLHAASREGSVTIQLNEQSRERLRQGHRFDPPVLFRVVYSSHCQNCHEAPAPPAPDESAQRGPSEPRLPALQYELLRSDLIDALAVNLELAPNVRRVLVVLKGVLDNHESRLRQLESTAREQQSSLQRAEETSEKLWHHLDSIP